MAQHKVPQLLKTVTVRACNRILSRGRELIERRGFEKENLGSDAFDSWSHMGNRTDMNDFNLPPAFEFHLRYQDSVNDQQGNNKSNQRIVLTSHGSPGSHEDYKYITPKLINSGGDTGGFRVLDFNWPEHGHSEVTDETEYFYVHSSDERSEILDAFMKRLEIKKVDVMVGHSFGCYPLFAFGTDETYRKQCGSLLLVNCGGPKPHKSLRPYDMYKWAASMSYRPFFGPPVRRMFYYGSKFMGLKVKSVEQTSNNLLVIAHLGYQQLPQRVDLLRQDPTTPRVLYVYAEDDPLIEKESCEELARGLGAPTPIDGDEDGALKKVQEWWTSWNATRKPADGGTKNFAVKFGRGRGGHFLQKHQADFLSSCIRVMSGGSQK